MQHARLTLSQSNALEEKKASSYEYENWSGIRRHVHDFNARVGSVVSSAAGDIGLAATGLGSNIAVQSLRGVEKTLKSGRENMTRAMNCTRDGVVTGLGYVDRGTRSVGGFVSRRLAALRDMIFGLENIMESRRSQMRPNPAINATNRQQARRRRNRN